MVRSRSQNLRQEIRLSFSPESSRGVERAFRGATNTVEPLEDPWRSKGAGLKEAREHTPNLTTANAEFRSRLSLWAIVAYVLEFFRMQPDLIFDVGCHNGNDTSYYLSRGFRVVAVEAHPQYCSAMYQRFPEAIAAGRLYVLNFAIAERPGLCTLLESQAESQWNTVVPEIAAQKSGDFREIIVPALTFNCVFERFNTPYYLKVDIEGSEINVFRYLVDRPQYISFEVNSDFSSILRILRDLGYTRYKLVNQRLIHLEAYASSGPFGEDAAGRWVNDKVLEEQLCTAQAPDRRHPDDWFDVHVGL